jgi:hypothetical protein
VTVFVDGFAMQAVTNDQGKYTLTGIPPGEQILVAMKPGFRTALKRDVSVPNSGRVMDMDLTLETDPNYVPDSVKIEQISPVPDSAFAPGQVVPISLTVRYYLTSATYGTVVITIQDEKNNPLIIAPMSHKVTKRTDTVSFTRQVTMPQRVKGEVHVIAGLFPGLVRDSDIADSAVYKIRSYKDSVRFSTILLVPDRDNAQSVSLSVSVGYTLDSIPSGIVRLRVFGDRGKKDFATTVYETQQSVDKNSAVSGTVDFKANLTLPSDVTALKVYAELLPSNGRSNLFDVTSKTYPLKKSQ